MQIKWKLYVIPNMYLRSCSNISSIFSKKISTYIKMHYRLLGRNKFLELIARKLYPDAFAMMTLWIFCNHLKLQMMWHFLKGLSIEIAFARGIWENSPSNHCRSSYQILNHISDHQMGTMQYQFCMCSWKFLEARINMFHCLTPPR